MVRTQNPVSTKLTVKLRKKRYRSGTKSLSPDILLPGRRLPKEYLDVILEGGERSSENKEKLRIERENQSFTAVT